MRSRRWPPPCTHAAPCPAPAAFVGASPARGSDNLAEGSRNDRVREHATQYAEERTRSRRIKSVSRKRNSGVVWDILGPRDDVGTAVTIRFDRTANNST